MIYNSNNVNELQIASLQTKRKQTFVPFIANPRKIRLCYLNAVEAVNCAKLLFPFLKNLFTHLHSLNLFMLLYLYTLKRHQFFW